MKEQPIATDYLRDAIDNIANARALIRREKPDDQADIEHELDEARDSLRRAINKLLGLP